ncbi:MAG: hypothetical protein H7250_04755 [Flavobacterium sp.]|nr:hypothetical protein [Flavobacterium sp.]
MYILFKNSLQNKPVGVIIIKNVSLYIFVESIKRSINILGVPVLIDKIKSWNAKYPTKGFAFIEPTYFKLYTNLIKTILKSLQKKRGF